MNIELNFWLQDAVDVFLRDWVQERVKQAFPDAGYVSVQPCRMSGTDLVVSWSYQDEKRRYPRKMVPLVTGSVVFTVREALQLFVLGDAAVEKEITRGAACD